MSGLRGRWPGERIGRLESWEEVRRLFGVCGRKAVFRRQGRRNHKSQLSSGDEGKGPECLRGVAP